MTGIYELIAKIESMLMKTTKSFWILYFHLIFVSAFSVGCAAVGSHPQYVSLIQLLASPQQYDRKIISVEGFYHGEFESYTLYLSEEDAKHLIMRNGIWIGKQAASTISNRIEGVNNTFVRVEGTFKYTPEGGGHLGGWLSEINQITLFVQLPERRLSNDVQAPR